MDDEAAFCEAGFEIAFKKRRSLMRVAIHPALKEYLFKVFFISEQHCEREKVRGWSGFAIRCEGAERIRRIIEDRQIRHFQVPHKWLFYPPYHPACSLDDPPVILVAEYQDLLPQSENECAWFNAVREPHLDELYAIIQGAGGASYRPDNIPRTKQGKFAFIDTEHSSQQRDCESIRPYLAPQMRQYWLDLIQSQAK